MTGHRIGVLIVAPFCLGLAAMVGVLSGVEFSELMRIVVLAGVGGWVLGTWR